MPKPDVGTGWGALKSLLRMKEKDYAWLASECYVGRRTVWNWACLDNEPGAQSMELIARALGVEARHLRTTYRRSVKDRRAGHITEEAVD